MVSFGFSTKRITTHSKTKYLKVEVIKVENVYGVDGYIPDYTMDLRVKLHQPLNLVNPNTTLAHVARATVLSFDLDWGHKL